MLFHCPTACCFLKKELRHEDFLGLLWFYGTPVKDFFWIHNWSKDYNLKFRCKIIVKEFSWKNSSLTKVWTELLNYLTNNRYEFQVHFRNFKVFFQSSFTYVILRFSHILQILAQKMKFSIKDFFSKCDQIRRNLPIWSHLLKKYLIGNFIFCAVRILC